jgi:arylsulfatase A-like enzyme
MLAFALLACSDPEPSQSRAAIEASDSKSRMTPIASPSGPNVLLITIDTLRADHLSAYGYPRMTSAAIDGLASEGVLFSRAIAQRASTWPSLASIHTGLHPRTHGVRANGELLAKSKKTIAEHLQSAGYATAAFITNTITAPNRGFDRKVTRGLDHPDSSRREGGDEYVTQAAREFILKDRSQPFFAWVHLIGPHDPYTPPASTRDHFETGYRGGLDGTRAELVQIHRTRRKLSREELAHIISRYDEEIVAVDRLVESLLAALKARGIENRTLVILTSDHGEELYQHDYFFLHALSIYDSVLHVPLILRLPGSLPAGVVRDEVVQTIDIAPTLFDLLRLTPDARFEGRSLVSDVLSGDVAFSELGPEIYSLRTRRWHFIYNPKGYSSIGLGEELHRGHRNRFDLARYELYDLDSDPSEEHNLVEQEVEVRERLQQKLEDWLENGIESGIENGIERKLDRRSPPIRPSPEIRAELESLGYLEGPDHQQPPTYE